MTVKKWKNLLLSVIVVFVLSIFLVLTAHATTNISSSTNDHFAWEDFTGWWDFFNTDTVQVLNSKVEGYASSSFGEISFDCATSPSGNICSSENDYYGVCNGPGPRDSGGGCPNSDAGGILSGWAWNDNIGWISFNCSDLGICGTSNYKVQIDSNGNFSGYAWNDLVGWINFNCANSPSGCGTSDYKVITSWTPGSIVGYLESSPFDTQKTAGTVLNNITWKGTMPQTGTGACVAFQIAVSNSSSGPWNYIGPSGTSTDYYGTSCADSPTGGIGCAEENTPICVNKNNFINYRYLKYKVKIQTTLTHESPQISNIILNWSP